MSIAMKSISLLMGEGVYQSGYEFDTLKYFGILPFPDLDMLGLTYFFLIRDERVRGKAKAATITVLLGDEDSEFLYQNIKTLRVLLDNTAQKFNALSTEEDIARIMENLKDECEQFDPSYGSARRLTRKIKAVFTGLDYSGKSSFLKSVENKYSELMGIAPTKGIERNERELLGTTLLEWDFGGQKNYRANYFKNAELYLSDIDLLFYIIDIQDSKRIEENCGYLNQLLTTLDNFKQYPPLILIFHKVDPDIASNKEIKNRIEEYKKMIQKQHKKWIIRYFQTTVFDHWSIISAFSYAISQLSPNREAFRTYLKWLTHKVGGNAAILLSRNAIILSDYSDNWIAGKFFEMSQASFYNIFMKLEEFELINGDYAQWEIGDFTIILKKIAIEGKEFFVLIQVKDEKTIGKLDDYIDSFRKKITSLINNYL